MLLGAGFGGLYAAALGTVLIFPIVGTVLGFFFGVYVGALVALPLGLLDGRLLLSWLVAGHRGVGHPNPRRLRLQAGLVCVGGSVLALLADWALHGLADPDGFAVFRAYLLSFEPIFTTKYLQTGVPLDVFGLSAWVFAPTLIALVASWLTGRRVATWYAGEVSES